MTSRFNDISFSREDRYALGIEEVSGRFYLSIPVSNRLVDYDEYYNVTPAEFEAFRANPAIALRFADRARNRELDDLLLIPPGMDRGVPR